MAKYLHIINKRFPHHIDAIMTIEKYGDLIHKGSRHNFLKFDCETASELETSEGISFLPQVSNLKHLFRYIRKSINHGDRVIFHGSHYPNVWQHFLKLRKDQLKRIGYINWGEGLDHPSNLLQKLYAKIRGKFIFNQLGFIIVLSLVDKEEFKMKYGPQKNIHFCSYIGTGEYLSKALEFSKNKTRAKAKIFLGHRNDENLKHIEILEKISFYPIEDIEQIYCPLPLNYGISSKDYALEVIDTGKKLFGEKFSWDLEFLPKYEYFEKICQYNIAIIPNYKRTQNALFVVFAAAASGAKVFTWEDDPNKKLLNHFDFVSHDINDIGIQPFSEFIKYDDEFFQKNFVNLKNNIGTETIIEKYKKIFSLLN